MKDPVLRVACPDQPGLVHQITKALMDEGANIVRNDEFVDRTAKHFFMRTEFQNVPAERWFPLEKNLRSHLPDHAVLTLEQPRPKNI
ncbi:MAG TPA: ACT domain-containing protein, partial [Alphaproteobacteria bacterium]